MNSIRDYVKYNKKYEVSKVSLNRFREKALSTITNGSHWIKVTPEFLLVLIECAQVVQEIRESE